VFPPDITSCNAGVVAQSIQWQSQNWRTLFDSQQWQEFTFATLSEPAQRTTEPKSLWVLGILPGEKLSEREADYSPLTTPSLNWWLLRFIVRSIYFRFWLDRRMGRPRSLSVYTLQRIHKSLRSTLCKKMDLNRAKCRIVSFFPHNQSR